MDLARRCSMAIDNARLYREARDAIGIRDEFLSVAAHELKTPMTSLRGYAQLLGREFERGDTPNPDRARRAALTIQVQADKLARLVAQLLDISRIESGKLALERKSTDITQLVRDVIETARTQLKEHTLVARLPDELAGRDRSVAHRAGGDQPARQRDQVQPRGRPDRRRARRRRDAGVVRCRCATAAWACRSSTARTSSIASTRRTPAAR